MVSQNGVNQRQVDSYALHYLGGGREEDKKYHQVLMGTMFTTFVNFSAAMKESNVP